MGIDRKIAETFPAKADPRPCKRCRHRADVHEDSRGLRYCRACEWIGIAWPCSTGTLSRLQKLDALSFDLGLDV